jgi:hypothetical protein
MMEEKERLRKYLKDKTGELYRTAYESNFKMS